MCRPARLVCRSSYFLKLRLSDHDINSLHIGCLILRYDQHKLSVRPTHRTLYDQTWRLAIYMAFCAYIEAILMSTSLRRYTELPYLIDFLRTRELVLLNPASWDDRNDSFYIKQYKNALRLKSAYALCLAESSETYHHWRVFSHGSGGVCIEFDKEALKKAARQVPGMRAEPVVYQTIKQLREVPPDQEELPFLKRSAFADEQEFRLFLGSRTSTADIYRFSMPLRTINRITLSPWLHKGATTNVRKILRTIAGCSKLPIYRSTLVENESWKRFAVGSK